MKTEIKEINLKYKITETSEVLDYIYDNTDAYEYFAIGKEIYEIRYLYKSVIQRLVISKMLFNHIKYKN